jgi:hypothetical protein
MFRGHTTVYGQKKGRIENDAPFFLFAITIKNVQKNSACLCLA